MADMGLKRIKLLIPDVMDNNGNFREIPTGGIGYVKLNDRNLELLKSFIRLLKDTDMLREETKAYIFDPYITLHGVYLKIKSGEIKMKYKYDDVGYNTIASRIRYDRDKITKELGANFIDRIISSKEHSEIDEIELRLVNAYKKYGSNKYEYIRNGIALDINSCKVVNSLSDEKFNQFIEIIAPYIKEHMKNVSKMLDEDSVGYFNYLLSSPMLTDVDVERLKWLEEMVGNVEN